MKDKGMSSEDAPKGKTSHNLTPKSIEEIAKEILGNNKTIEIFEIMAIVSQKWVINLGLEVKSLKTRLTIVEGEMLRLLKQMKQE
jgi:hypothetical protein